VREGVERAMLALDALLATADTGEMLRTGATVVIAGAPNTGKSSLFNALVGDARAIVTEVPGTTRDAIEAVVDVGAWPVRLIDTAGIRETGDVVERLGIEVSERWLGRSDLIIACGDDADSLCVAIERVRSAAPADVPVIAVWTKADEAGGPPPDFTMPHSSTPPITVSAHTGTGLSTLTDRIQDELRTRHRSSGSDAPLLTRERHVRAVRTAREELEAFGTAREIGAIPATIAAVHLRAATHALEALIGAVDVEDVLDRVFSSFCVGK
jgi:tRNA modification GTPase